MSRRLTLQVLTYDGKRSGCQELYTGLAVTIEGQ